MGVKYKTPLMKEHVLREKGTHLTVRVQRASSRPAAHMPIEDFDLGHFAETYLPVRESSNYRSRKTKIGFLWMAKLGRVRAYESLLERSVLLDMDRDPNIINVWSQPFRIDGIDPNRGHRYVRPTPDLLVQWADESLEVVEVKPHRKLIEPQVEWFNGDLEKMAKARQNYERLLLSYDYEARELAAIGIGFSTRSELPAQVRKNLEYLSLYRRPLPKNDPLPDRVREQAADGPVSLGELADRAGGFISAMPVILHLVWHRELDFDLELPLNSSTIVHMREAAKQVMAA